MAGMTRVRQVFFRVNEEEYAALERAARKDRRTVSDFVRNVLMLDLMLDFDHTFMTDVRNQVRRRIEEGTFQRELPVEKKKRA